MHVVPKKSLFAFCNLVELIALLLKRLNLSGVVTDGRAVEYIDQIMYSRIKLIPNQSRI